MPALIPVVAGAWAASAATAAATGAVVGGITISAAAAGVIGAVAGGVVSGVISTALTPDTPQASDNFVQQARGVLVNATGNVEPIPVIYGSRTVGGPRILTEVTGTNNEYLHVIIVLSEGPISAINTVYLDDTASDDSRFSGLVTIEKYLGTDAQSASAALISDLGGKWTSDDKLSGIAYIYLKLEYTAAAFARGLPRITADIDGRTLYDPRDTNTKFSNNPLLAIRDYLTNTRYGRGIPTAAYDDTAGNAAANICEERVSAPSYFAGVTADASTDIVTVGSGVRFPMLTGDGISVSTTGTLPAPLVAATTYYVVRVGDTGFKLATSFANAFAGTTIDITDAGTGSHTLSHDTIARYTCDGVINVDDNQLDNYRALLSSCRGYAIYAGGKHKVIIDQAETPTTFEFTEDNILGSWTIQPATKRTKANRVRAQFYNHALRWQPDYAVYDNTTDRTADNELLLETQIQLPFTASAYRARQIAELEERQSRVGIVCKFRATIAGLQCEIGDVVPITHTTPGWTSQPFRILRIEILSNDEVEITARQYDAGVYSIDTPDPFVPASATNLPSPFSVSPPSGLTFTQSRSIPDRAVIEWTAAPDAFAFTYQVEWQQTGAAAWTILPLTTGGAVNIENLEPYGYNFRVKAYSALGVGSTYATVSGTMIEIPVPNVTGLEIEGQGVDRVFTGRDLKLSWRRGSTDRSYDVGSEPFGGNSGAPDYFFKDFEVAIWNPDYPTSLLLLTYTTDPFFVYTREMYYAARESNYLLTGIAARTLCIEVRQRGKYNQKSAKPAKLTVSNPQMATPTGETLTAKFNGFTLAAEVPTEPDFRGMVIFASTSASFTPAAANLVYKGSDTTIDITGLTPNTLYYVRYAFYDDFDSSIAGINVSAELSVTTAQVQTADMADSAVTTGKIAAGNVITTSILSGAVSESGISEQSGSAAISGTYTGSTGAPTFTYDIFTGASVTIASPALGEYSMHYGLFLTTGTTAHTQGMTLDRIEFDGDMYADLGNATVTQSSYGGYACLLFTWADALPAAVTGSSGDAYLIVDGQPIFHVRYIDTANKRIYASSNSSPTSVECYLLGSGTFPATKSAKFYAAGSTSGFAAGVEDSITAIASTKIQLSKKSFSNIAWTESVLFLVTCRAFPTTAAGDYVSGAQALVNRLKV